MPTVEKVSGGRVTVRHIGQFEIDDRKEVSDEDAEYLVEERGDFEYVDSDDDTSSDGDETETSSAEEETSEKDSDAEPESVANEGDDLELASDYIREQIDAGVCPWCDDYEGDAVPQHASSAHPDEWAGYKGD